METDAGHFVQRMYDYLLSAVCNGLGQNGGRFGRSIRQTAAEGAVLLKNEDQTLPVKPDETVSVFGRIQINYFKSGTGSGGKVNVDHVTTFSTVSAKIRRSMSTRTWRKSMRTGLRRTRRWESGTGPSHGARRKCP